MLSGLTATWTSAMRSTNKKVGCIYEQAFFVEALRHGLDVFQPVGDYLPVDCLTMNGAGKVFKVQIKGSSKVMVDPKRDVIGRYKVVTSSGQYAKTPIDCTKVDIVACYCAADNAWYLIPCMEIDSAKTISLAPHNPKSKGKHEKYREAWEIFKTT